MLWSITSVISCCILVMLTSSDAAHTNNPMVIDYLKQDARFLKKKGGMKAMGKGMGKGMMGMMGMKMSSVKEIMSRKETKKKVNKKGIVVLPPKPPILDCSFLPFQDIVAQALVTFVGRPDDVTEGEIKVLEITFASVYNNLVDCTASERNIVQVEIIQDITQNRRQRHRSLQQTLTVTRPFTFFFRISIRCRGCSGDFLFNNDGFRRQRHLLQPHEQQQQQTFPTTTTERILRKKKKDMMGSVKKMTQGKDGKKKKGKMVVPSPVCPACNAPTSEAFTTAYDIAIRFLAANGTLPSIDSVQQVSELLPVQCEAQADIIETRVIVDFAIAENENPNDQDLVLLALAFQNTYNSINALNFDTCDLRFREIVKVEIESTDFAFSRRRRLQPFNNNNAPRRPFLFLISFRCRGCTSDDDLFDDGFRRVLEQMTTKTTTTTATTNLMNPFDRNLQTVEGDCACTPDPPILRAPTRTEFTIAYQVAVEILISQEELSISITVVGIREVESISCPSPNDGLQTGVKVIASGYPVKVSPKGTSSLEEGIVDVFNNLVESFCDPVFRTVLNAYFVGPIALSPSTKLKPGKKTSSAISFAFHFIVDYQCRGCDPKTPLFDVVDARRMLGLPAGPSSRSLREFDDTCFCDVNPVSRRSPTTQEFQDALMDAINSGKVNATGITSVIRVMEMPISALPTTEFPSQSPVTSSPVTDAPVAPAPTAVVPTKPTKPPISVAFAPIPIVLPVAAPVSLGKKFMKAKMKMDDKMAKKKGAMMKGKIEMKRKKKSKGKTNNDKQFSKLVSRGKGMMMGTVQ